MFEPCGLHRIRGEVVAAVAAHPCPMLQGVEQVVGLTEWFGSSGHGSA
jgi:hypothetical protein